MLWPLFSAALSGAIAQTLLPIRATGPAAGFVELAWTTDGGFHELQSTPTLTDPDWRVLLRSEQTGFRAPVSGRAAFFRVLSLPGWEERQVTDARRIEVLAAIAGRVGELATEETDAAAAALELFLRGFEELEGIRVAEDGSMQARFTDGRPLWIINNRLPATDEQLAASGMFAPSRKAGVSTRGRVDPRLTATGTRPPTGVPESRRAAMFQASLPGLAAPMLASLGPAFAARGYDVVGGEASLENLLALEAEGDDLGVFYIDTHGGFGMARRAEPVPPGTAGDG
ncbi:MAG: hypothetical protein KDM81_21765, partial [Verrucomicrobiae bacterium]|nr:hypothetical protein [Verrucomicrobiae bacterium]